jgi:tRNA nucleotidyltransferase (CCA-adding enzyme)
MQGRIRSKRDVQLQALCSSELLWVSPTDAIREAIRLLLKSGHTGLPVLVENEVVGIISLSDIVKAYHNGLKPDETKAEEIMSKDVIIKLNPEMNFEEALNTLRSFRVRRAPIVQHGIVVGFVTKDGINDAYDLILHMQQDNEQESAMRRAG